MAKTQTSCPRCRQPVVADINQLFDASADPQAKQRILSGEYNLIHCQSCGYEGNLATPIVYHDAEKELLLTFFPPELRLPVNEQERMIGPLITQVMNRLPNEKRKGYLLRPQPVLTMQGLVERILEKDGITKEMIQAQQDRLNLLQRLMTATSDDVRTTIAKESDALMDEQFYGLISQLADASMQGGDEKSARQLAELQKMLLPLSTVGRKLKEENDETEAAVKSLQEASQKGLSREALLDLMINAPTETRLFTLVSMARSGMDYIFFQLLTDHIDRAEGDEKKKLMDLRSKVLSATDKIDTEVKKQVEVAHKLLDELLNAPDIGKATSEHLPQLTELFVEVLKGELNTANQKKDQARLDKLQQIVAVLQQASQPAEEIALIEDLLGAPDEAALKQVMEENKEAINEEFLQFFGNILNQAQSQPASQKQDPRMIEKLQSVYRAALRFSMQSKLQAG
jgi:hypothetical protein